jgi:phosphomevalonate kinase
MTERREHASAPGKIVLLGEYAVLGNAPALVAAVDRFASADIAAREDGPSRVVATNLDVAPLEFECAAGRIRWRRRGGDLALMQVLLAALARRGVLDAATEAFECRVDSADFYRDHEKIGLGSSAATSTAVALALHRWAGQAPPADAELTDFLISVHREHQDGSGSGLDIAAAVRGGVFSFARPEGAAEPPAIDSLSWPGGLYWCVVWTGQPASTSAYLATLRAYANQNPAAYQQQMTRLGEISRIGIAAFDEGGIDNFLDAVNRYMYALTEFGRTTGLDIVSHSHRGLAGLADISGVVYKPCGAGGGDIGIAFSGRREPLTVFAEQVRRSGQSVLSLGLAGAAVRNVGYP